MVETAGAKKLPFLELPAFLNELRKQMGVAARALEFLILTATRTSEALNATWGEFDLEEAKVWTTPTRRVKARVEHRVPLSGRAFEILGR
jgi:integrase